ncbi:MAG: hypothetical protein ABL993_05275 [Vicinamibacterales bacterium]
MGAAAREGNAALRLTAPGGSKYTHLLNRPLKFSAAPARRQIRYTRDSLDLSAREVIGISSGRAEIETLVKFERSAEDLIEIMQYAAAGTEVYYYPDLEVGTSYPLWLIDEGDQVALGLQGGREAFQEYERPLRFRDASTSGQSLEPLFSPWLFKYEAGMVGRLMSMARTGTVGPYIDGDGVLKQMAANLPRVSWEDDDEDGAFDTPTLLLEAPAFINLVSSDNFDSGWASSASAPAVTASISDPAGGTSAYRIADDHGTNIESKSLVVAFTGNGVKALTFTVREATMPGAGGQALQLYDDTGAAARLTLNISAWVSGKPTVAAATGTLLGVDYVGNGYWAIHALTTSVTAASTHRAEVYPAATGTAQGSIDIFRVNAYNATSAPRSILNASATKAAESLTFPWVHKPRQAWCGHIRFRELESPSWSNNLRVIHLGASSDAVPRFTVYRPSGGDSYQIYHQNHASAVVSVSVDINPLRGDLIDLFPYFYSDGSVNLAARKKSPGGSWGSITTGTRSVALTLAPDWSDDVMHFGSVGSTDRGSQAYHRVVIAPDSALTTTELLAL